MNRRSKNSKNFYLCLNKLWIVLFFLFPQQIVLSQKNSEQAQVNFSDDRNPGDVSLDLYLLIGQSNMAGRGVITNKYKEQRNENVWMLNKENTWVPARNPLHFDKPKIAGVGPGLSFGIAISKEN